MRRFLLDTCAMGDFINRRKGVHERAREARLDGARLGTCVPVVGELFFGIELSQTRDENHARLTRAWRDCRSGPTHARPLNDMDVLPPNSGEQGAACSRSTFRLRPLRSR